MNSTSSSSAEPSARVIPEPSVGMSVEIAIIQLAVIHPGWLRVLLAYSPFAIGMVLLADLLLLNGNLFVRDPLRLSGMVMVIVALLLFQALFNKAPNTLRALWDRGVIGDPIARVSQAGQEFTQFISEYSVLLNSRAAWIVAVVFALIGLLGTYKVRAWFQFCAAPWVSSESIRYCTDQFNLTALAQDYLWGNAAITAPLLGVFLGLVSWRLFVISLCTYRLTTRFRLNVQFRHPDGRGGLKPFGDLCLLEASLLIVPALFFALWGMAIESSIIMQLLGIAAVNVYSLLWSGFYRVFLVVILNVAALWVFFGPVYRVHQQMTRRRDEMEQRVDALSGKAAAMPDDLLANSGAWLQRQLMQLRDGIVSAFSAEELESLCFDLGVDYENLDAAGKDDKARKLVEFMNRAGRLGELAVACRKQRPLSVWPDMQTYTPAPGRPEKLEDLAPTYQAIENAPIWPLDRSTLLIALVLQTALVASLVAAGVLSG